MRGNERPDSEPSHTRQPSPITHTTVSACLASREGEAHGSSFPMIKRTPHCCGGISGGQGRGRTGDLSLFRRTLLPTELPGRWVACSSPSDPDGTRTRDLRRDRAARYPTAPRGQFLDLLALTSPGNSSGTPRFWEIGILTTLQPTSGAPNRRFPGIPNGIRTRVAAVKGRSPRPLDDGDRPREE